MNGFNLPSRADALAATSGTAAGSFYRQPIKLDVEGRTFEVEVYDYRTLAKSQAFAEVNGWELRGITFVRNPSIEDSSQEDAWRRYLLLNKFFNYGECAGWLPEDFSASKITRIQDKADGSLINFIPFCLAEAEGSSGASSPTIVFRAKSKTSFTSKQAAAAQSVFDRSNELRSFLAACFSDDLMPVFELIGTDHEIAVKYAASAAVLVLLQIRNNTTGEYLQRGEVARRHNQHFLGHHNALEGEDASAQTTLPACTMQQILRGAVTLNLRDVTTKPPAGNFELFVNTIYGELAKRHSVFLGLEYELGTCTSLSSEESDVAASDVDVDDLLKVSQTVEIGNRLEGFIVQFSNGKFAKLKTAAYCAQHKDRGSAAADDFRMEICKELLAGTVDDRIAGMVARSEAERIELERLNGLTGQDAEAKAAKQRHGLKELERRIEDAKEVVNLVQTFWAEGISCLVDNVAAHYLGPDFLLGSECIHARRKMSQQVKQIVLAENAGVAMRYIGVLEEQLAGVLMAKNLTRKDFAVLPLEDKLSVIQAADARKAAEEVLNTFLDKHLTGSAKSSKKALNHMRAEQESKTSTDQSRAWKCFS